MYTYERLESRRSEFATVLKKYSGAFWLVILATFLNSCTFKLDRENIGSSSTSTENIGGQTTPNSPMSLTLSSSSYEGQASGLLIKGRIQPTQRNFGLGTDAAVKLTISSQRVNPQ